MSVPEAFAARRCNLRLLSIEQSSLWSLLPKYARVTIVIVAIAGVAIFLFGRWPVPESKRVRGVKVELAPPVVTPTELIDIPPEDARVTNAKVPVVSDFVPASRSFVLGGSDISRARAVDCLAAAEWYEAGDDAPGERAVAQVVLNRVRHPAFPSTVCGVVFQGAERKTGCQFTFVCDGSLTRTPAPVAWQRARAIAMAALNGEVMKSVGYATHYHADYVVPYWQSSLDKIAVIGAHLFYRWPGYWGTSAAFRRAPSPDEPIETLLAHLSIAHIDTAGTGVVPDPALTTIVDGQAPPIAITLPDQGKSDLRGSEPRFAAADGRTIFLKLDPAAFPGGYASTALGVCQGKPTCQVLGWRDAEHVGTGLPLAADANTALSFLYIRKNGSEAVLWNCAQTPRTSASQCLPTDAAAIRRLMLSN